MVLSRAGAGPLRTSDSYDYNNYVPKLLLTSTDGAAFLITLVGCRAVRWRER